MFIADSLENEKKIPKLTYKTVSTRNMGVNMIMAALPSVFIEAAGAACGEMGGMP
jgi:hypothetical protein